MILRFTVRDIYLVFVPLLAWAPKTLENFYDETPKGTFCNVNEVILETHKRMGQGSPGEPTIEKSWNFQCHPPRPPEQGKGLEVDSSTNGQSFNQLCVCNEASIKTQRTVFWELLCWQTSWDSKRVAYSERAWKLLALSSYIALSISSIWLFLSCSFLK